jgi:Protein of unknown function (DUF3500)
MARSCKLPRMADSASLTRRAFLGGAAAGAGWLLARGLGGGPIAGATPPANAILSALAASLTPRQRELVVFPADHPSRQITNTISVLERPHLGTLLSPSQRDLVQRLYESMLSEPGREAFAATLAVEGRLDGCVLAIYGEPERGGAHAVIMGGHLMLRTGGEAADGSPFGGGCAYGQQVGNGRWRVAGNAFAAHGDAANRFTASLAPEERARALLPTPPHELVLQVQGARGRFPGVRVGSVSETAQREAERLLDTVLATYPEAQRRQARACVDANGGIGALSFACYEDRGFYADMASYASLPAAERTRRGEPYWQVWRLEGPAAIVHFKGHPHVHAYVQVVRDPAQANVGEPLGELATPLADATLRELLEGALRRATGEALAFHADEIPGRFCAGPVTTGLAYALDPYRNRVAVATIAGAAMAPPLRDRLAARGAAIDPAATYRIATLEYFAGRSDWFGEPSRVERGNTLFRDALVAHLRAGAPELA